MQERSRFRPLIYLSIIITTSISCQVEPNVMLTYMCISQRTSEATDETYNPSTLCEQLIFAVNKKIIFLKDQQHDRYI